MSAITRYILSRENLEILILLAQYFNMPLIFIYENASVVDTAV